MTDVESTYSVEVLGFSAEADPEELAASVSRFFGISLEEGRRLVGKAPIRVKRNAAPDVAQQLVRQLLKLGADVVVRNEQSGDERTYRVPERKPARDSTVPAESVRAAEAAPRSKKTGRTSSSPDSGSPSGERDSFEPAPRSSQPFGPVSGPRPPATLSLPPPSSPLLGAAPVSAKIDFCGSCTRPVDKGETCTRCGWNNARKVRSCRQCKRPLVVVSAVTHKPAVLGAIAIASCVISVALFFLFGGVVAAALLSLCAGASLLVDALTLRHACKSCAVAVYSEKLQKEEAARLRIARGKSLSLAIACAAIMGGFLAVTSFSGRTLSSSAFGIAWTLPIPWTHDQVGSEVASIRVPAGERRMRVQFAERPYVGGATYSLAHLQYSHPAGPAEPDKPGLEAAMKQVVEVVYAGTLSGPAEPAGDSLEVAFSGTFHGKKVFGRMRGTQYEHDLLFVVVSAPSEEDTRGPSVQQFLSSVAVAREVR